MKLATSVHHWPWQPLIAGLLCAGVGFVVGGVPWQDEIDALQHLQQEVPALHSRLAAMPVVPAPSAGAADADLRRAELNGPQRLTNWPDVRQAAAFWPGLQQRLQGRGLQLQSLKPGPQEVLAGWSTQTVLLDVQGLWDHWRMFEQQLDQYVPGWVVSRWQVTPLQAAANGSGDTGQVRMQWHVQWAWPADVSAVSAEASLPGGGEWPDGLAVLAPARTAPLFAVPGVATSPQSNAQSAVTTELVGPAAQWPVQALRFQGVWQQAGVLHAVLGSGLQQVVVAPGQAVGREAYRVLRVGPDEVVLQPPHAAQAPLRLGWSGGGK